MQTRLLERCPRRVLWRLRPPKASDPRTAPLPESARHLLHAAAPHAVRRQERVIELVRHKQRRPPQLPQRPAVAGCLIGIGAQVGARVAPDDQHPRLRLHRLSDEIDGRRIELPFVLRSVGILVIDDHRDPQRLLQVERDQPVDRIGFPDSRIPEETGPRRFPVRERRQDERRGLFARRRLSRQRATCWACRNSFHARWHLSHRPAGNGRPRASVAAGRQHRNCEHVGQSSRSRGVRRRDGANRPHRVQSAASPKSG